MRPFRALLLPCAAFSWTLASVLVAGCPIAPTNVAAGGRCQRSVQCMPGLVCNAMGVCTGDLTGFGTGMVPVVDAGAGMDVPMMIDAGPMDTPPVPDVPMDAPAMPDVPVIMPDVPMVMPDVPVVMPDVPVVMPDVPDMPDTGDVDAP